MSEDTSVLGGCLPPLGREPLAADQRQLYALIDTQWVPWGDAAKFHSKTADGRLIGSFNATLFTPEIPAAQEKRQAFGLKGRVDIAT